MATLAEVRAWSTSVSRDVTQLQLDIAAERSKPLPIGDLEQRLQVGRIGHMRYRLASLQALQRFLTAGMDALVASQPHPVQMLTAPATSSGTLSVPKKPPAGTDY